jgi:cyclopropane fatty-acyl-phospholipid synthase-like methyltransferase
MFHFPSLTVSDEVGLFSFLNQAPATHQEVATSLALGERATEALLGVMTSLGYLVQNDSKFSLTEVSKQFLLPDSPFYWGGILHLMRSLPFSHTTLLESLQNDKATVYDEKDIWETHEIDLEQAKAFTRHMHSQTVAPAAGAAFQHQFTDVKRLLDVGGGSGAFSFALARQHPDLHCTILELPVVCDIAQGYIAEAGLHDRVDTHAADFFKEPFPAGYDAVLFSNILHDWGLQKCSHLVQQSFAALPPGGQIFIHEILLSETKDTPLVATAFSMCMVWVTEGKQFALHELEQLLTEAGFEEITLSPAYGYYSLVSAKKGVSTKKDSAVISEKNGKVLSE